MKTKNFLVVLFIFCFIVFCQLLWQINLLQRKALVLKEINDLNEQNISLLQASLLGKEDFVETLQTANQLLKEEVLLLEQQNSLLLEGTELLKQSVELCSERSSILEVRGAELEIGLGVCQVQLIECLTPLPEDPGGAGDEPPLGAPEEHYYYWF